MEGKGKEGRREREGVERERESSLMLHTQPAVNVILRRNKINQITSERLTDFRVTRHSMFQEDWK